MRKNDCPDIQQSPIAETTALKSKYPIASSCRRLCLNMASRVAMREGHPSFQALSAALLPYKPLEVRWQEQSGDGYSKVNAAAS
jgi:hypothetical protein